MTDQDEYGRMIAWAAPPGAGMTPDRVAAGYIAAWAAFAWVLLAIHSQIGGPWVRYTLLLVLLWILLRHGPEVFGTGSRLLSQLTDARPREWFPLAPRS